MENGKTQETAEKAAPFYKRWAEQDELQAAMHRLKEYLQILKEWKQRRQSKQRVHSELVDDPDEGRVSS